MRLIVALMLILLAPAARAQDAASAPERLRLEVEAFLSAALEGTLGLPWRTDRPIEVRVEGERLTVLVPGLVVQASRDQRLAFGDVLLTVALPLAETPQRTGFAVRLPLAIRVIGALRVPISTVEVGEGSLDLYHDARMPWITDVEAEIAAIRIRGGRGGAYERVRLRSRTHELGDGQIRSTLRVDLGPGRTGDGAGQTAFASAGVEFGLGRGSVAGWTRLVELNRAVARAIEAGASEDETLIAYQAGMAQVGPLFDALRLRLESSGLRYRDPDGEAAASTAGLSIVLSGLDQDISALELDYAHAGAAMAGFGTAGRKPPASLSARLRVEALPLARLWGIFAATYLSRAAELAADPQAEEAANAEAYARARQALEQSPPRAQAAIGFAGGPLTARLDLRASFALDAALGMVAAGRLTVAGLAELIAAVQRQRPRDNRRVRELRDLAALGGAAAVKLYELELGADGRPRLNGREGGWALLLELLR